MDASESFYHQFDTFDSEFSDPKRNIVTETVNSSVFPGNEESLKFNDLGFYNEESIDLQQYLHLGNTPPNGNGDELELLKQFGAYSSSPPVTVNVKSIGLANHINGNTTHTLTQGLAGFSLSHQTTAAKSQEANIVNSALSSTATLTQLGFQIKQEVEEHSVPEFDQPIDMPPGEEQAMTIAKGDQGNLGGQQFYIFKTAGAVHNEDVVTSSGMNQVQGLASGIHGSHSYGTSMDDIHSPDNSPAIIEDPEVTTGPKKRQRTTPNKESHEYKTKRQRNNLAVRKSREKSKVRNQDLQGKVTALQTDNDKLNKKVELLTKELTVLRSLFTTVKPTTNV